MNESNGPRIESKSESTISRAPSKYDSPITKVPISDGNLDKNTVLIMHILSGFPRCVYILNLILCISCYFKTEIVFNYCICSTKLKAI